MFKLYLLLVLCGLLVGCSSEIKLSDTGIVVTERMYSPDMKYVVYSYYFDGGGLGSSPGRYVVMKTTDTLGDISKYELPCPLYECYVPDRWINNKSLHVTLDETEFIRKGIAIDTTGFKIGDVRVSISVYDPTERRNPSIEHYSISPDGSRLLVAYRYGSINSIEVSAFDIVGDLPRRGNVLINHWRDDFPLLFGKWWANDTIELLLDDSPEYYRGEINTKHPHHIKITKENYHPQYSGIMSGWYNKPLHPIDNRVSARLQKYGRKANAVISYLDSWGDSYHTGLTNYFYKYKVNGKYFASYFRDDPNRNKLRNGGLIEIVYDTQQPIIHEPVKYRSRVE